MTSKYLTHQHFNVAFKLVHWFPSCYFTGGFGLSLLSIIDRYLPNIDICIPLVNKEKTLMKLKSLKITYTENKLNYFSRCKFFNFAFTGSTTGSRLVFDYNDYSYKILIDRIVVNIFFTKDETPIMVIVKDKQIHVSNPASTIRAIETYNSNRFEKIG
jgi:hypothetical protein